MPSAPESVIAAAAAATMLSVASSTKITALTPNQPAAAKDASPTTAIPTAATKKTWSPSPEPRDQTADDNDSTGDTSPATRSSPSTTAPLSPGRAAMATSSGEAAVVVAGPTGSNQSSPSPRSNDGDGEAADSAGLYLDSLGMLIESSVGKIDGSPGNKRVLGIGRLSKEEVAEADALAAAAIDTSATAISAEDEAAVAEVVAAAEAEVRSPTSGRGKGKGMGFNVPVSAASTTAAARRAAEALPTTRDTSGAGPAVANAAELARAAVPELITVLTVEEAASESMPEMKARLLQNQTSLDRQLHRARAKLATRQLHVDLWRTQWLAGSAPGVQQLPDRPTADAVGGAANELRAHAAGFLQQRKRSAGGRAVRHAARRMDRMVTRSLGAVDADQTDWSSCQSSESESEMVDANGHPLPVAMSNPVSAVRRKRRKIQQKWDGERAEIGWRWAWLNLKLKALNEQLDGHEDLQRKIREGKQPVDFGVIPAATSLFQVGDKVTLNETGEQCQVTAIDPALPGDYDTFLSIRFPSGDVREQRGSDIRVHGTPAPAAEDAAADPGCARARPMKSGFGKRKLIRGHVNAPTVSHNAFRAVSAPLVHSDRNAIRARSALLDRSFHLVLSLPSDAPESVLSRARHHRKMVRSQDPRKKASFYGHSRTSSLAASRRGSGSSMAGMGSPRRTSIKSEPYSMDGIESPRHDSSTQRITTKYVKVLRVESGDLGKLGTPAQRKSGEKDKSSLLSRRKKGSRDSDSIDNIMIPQILTPSRYEPLVVKEILTPSWNKSTASTPLSTPASSGHFTGFGAVPEGDAGEGNVGSADAAEPEVLSDAVFSLRHSSAELAEKNRFIGLSGSMGGANKQKANAAAPDGGGGPDKISCPKEAPAAPIIRVLEIRAAAIPPHPGWTARPFPLNEQDNAAVVAELPRIELVVPQYKEWKRAQEEARLAAEELSESESEPEPEPEAPKPIRLIFKISQPASASASASASD